MSNPLPNTLGAECAEGRLPLHHPWRRINTRIQHATRAYRQLGMDLDDATEALAYSQRTDIVQLDAQANTDAAMHLWDRAAIRLLESPSLNLADLCTVVRLSAGLMRLVDPNWFPHPEEAQTGKGINRSDLAILALYRAVQCIERNAAKGGAK